MTLVRKIWNQKIFFHCRCENLLSLLRVWTALAQSVSEIFPHKTCANCWILSSTIQQPRC